ncbi:hypothetical protein HU200_052190 [Digitaria exilis]|uniref:Uncharacterized protein n=1 Tax=Digitaria exilis TaxID=1010633 RepID=A0A835E981_9POAL|nr:hypothetical protein HU200_052190 [Digitaria exilis]
METTTSSAPQPRPSALEVWRAIGIGASLTATTAASSSPEATIPSRCNSLSFGVPCDINPKSYAIGEIEDGVCCLAAVDSVGELNTLHLRVWKLEKLEWKMEKEMQVRKVLGKHAPRGHSYYRVRKVTNGLALLGWSNGNLYFIIDLKTFCVMEKFEFSRHVHAFPMQMPWPPTFSVAAVDGDDNQPELKLGDGGASQDCMPPKTPENLGIQDATVASVSTPAGEECFRKKNQCSR